MTKVGRSVGFSVRQCKVVHEYTCEMKKAANFSMGVDVVCLSVCLSVWLTVLPSVCFLARFFSIYLSFISY